MIAIAIIETISIKLAHICTCMCGVGWHVLYSFKQEQENIVQLHTN